MLRHTRTLGIVRVNEEVWKRLSREEKVEIEKICDEKLELYYKKVNINESTKGLDDFSYSLFIFLDSLVPPGTADGSAGCQSGKQDAAQVRFAIPSPL